MTLEWRGTVLTSVAIQAQVLSRGGNFEEGGVGKGNVARSHAKSLPGRFLRGLWLVCAVRVGPSQEADTGG